MKLKVKIGLFCFFMLIQITGISQLDMRSGYTGPLFANRNPEVMFYPNPVINDLYIKFPYEVPQIEVSLYSYMGERLIHTTYYNSHIIDIELRYLPQGIYFIHIITSDEIFLKQIHKEN